LCQLQFDYWRKPEIFADAADFLKQHPLPIVSNIDTADLKVAIAYHQLNHITDIITSESVKFYKPRIEMFHKALEKSNLSPEDVIHIGDSLTSDVAGAQSAGIKTVWLNRTRKINVHNKKSEYIIHSFDEILNII
jgi:2-haloacid dehalogenase/putative hydrolase of the HAD superfamily